MGIRTETLPRTTRILGPLYDPYERKMIRWPNVGKKGASDIFDTTLHVMRHIVASIMLLGDASEEKRHDAEHWQVLGRTYR